VTQGEVTNFEHWASRSKPPRQLALVATSVSNGYNFVEELATLGTPLSA
jgi:hypothetical protein